MAVDFNKDPEILVIHGVQTGDNNDQRQHEYIESTLNQLLSSPDMHFDDPLEFTTNIFKYEDINDKATKLIRRVLSSMTGNAIAGWMVDRASDLVGDVLLALSEGAAYNQIKHSLADTIRTIHADGRPVYLVAHSLGTFYALEVINDFFSQFDLASNDKANWPVQGLVTIGSPLGLDLFKRGADSLNRRKIGVTIQTKPRFPWKNFWDRQDPIVTGSIMGYPKQSDFGTRFDRHAAKQKGWNIRSEEVNAGHTAHLAAHTAYWRNTTVGHGIINMIYLDRANN